ncbi:response regulator [Myxococcota bacterium]|nr:response regulator [Myxococcota bacterium]
MSGSDRHLGRDVLRILHLEDDRADGLLIESWLEHAGVEATIVRVETRAEFELAVERERWAAIFSDYSLPGYDGASALGFARRTCPNTPFIIVSGTLGEDAAVGSLLAGATDYVLKNRLARLVPALQRALREADERSARRSAEEALAASERSYRRLFEGSRDGLLLVEAATGRIVDANRAVEALLGRRRAELIDKTVPETGVLPDAQAERAFTALLTGPERRQVTRLSSAGGRTVEVDVLGTDDHAASRVVLLIFRDITERLLLEDELRQAQKLEAVGRLAGGIAHDFNNLLVVINNYAHFALESLGAAHPLHGDLDEVHKAGLRAAKLTHQLLAFSRKQILAPEVCCLNGVISELEKMLRRVIGEDVELELRLAPELGSVLVDPGQIEQVLMNLVVNARDAMEDGGRIVIETTNVPRTEGPRDVDGPKGFVRLAVRDTGCGMDEATRARIFEPFFTTKEPGRGTGLGLSTVYGIVKQSGGDVQVESEPGRGTTFRILLPRSDEAEPAPPATPEIAQTTAQGRGVILVVEDDASIRRLVQRVLEGEGYEVLTAGSSPEAITLAEQHPRPIELLLADIVLPGMNGQDLAKLLASTRPHLRVLFMSGYPTDVGPKRIAVDPATTLVQKPFAVATLTTRIREALSS